MDTLNVTSASLRDFLHIIFKRKAEILLFFIVTVSTVGIATLVVKPTYEASSQILVKVGRENLYVPTVPTSGNLNPIISVNRQEQLNSEIEILKSRSLAEEVIKSLGPATIYKDVSRSLAGRHSPMEKAFLKLRKKLKVEGIKKSDVIQVKFKHKDPQMAATVVNTLIKYYLDRHLQVFKSPQSSSFFQQQTNVLRKKLMQVETNLKDFKRQHNLSSLEQQKTLLLKQEADLRAALNQTLSQEAETENRLSELRMQLAKTPKTVSQDEVSDHNPYLINTLQARLVELQLKEKKLLLKYTEENRLVRNTKEEVEIVRNKLAEQENKLYGKSRSGRNPTYQRLQDELFRNEAELKALHAKRLTQSAQSAEYDQELKGLNRIEVELSQLKQEVDVDRENYQLYLSKFEESRISDAMDAEKMANVSLIEAAQPPMMPVSPKVFLNIILSIFLGSFGGLGLAFFLEYLDDSLENDSDVEECLQLPVLASIPKLSN
jgi:polysaccharide chain length determinant protein (PEP-CTERM system associated)